jgi:CDP-diacylglycerol--glycerol-3-phosphate 3-phosphatidyltransferase
MDDNEFLRAFLAGWPAHDPFHHYDHLRIAWLVIDRHGPEMAAQIVGERLKAMAVARAVAPLYNETMTRFWIRLIAHVRQTTAAASVDEAVEKVPMLRDKNLALRHWSRTAMFGPDARATWVEPDVAALPF